VAHFVVEVFNEPEPDEVLTDLVQPNPERVQRAERGYGKAG
jgi:hypothetical protein